MPDLGDAWFAGMVKKLRMEIMPSFLLGIVLFYGKAMSIGPGVLAHAGHLPGDFDAASVGANFEFIVGDFGGDYRLRELTDHLS